MREAYSTQRRVLQKSLTPSPSAGSLLTLLDPAQRHCNESPFKRAASQWDRDDLARIEEWMSLALAASEVGLWEWNIATDRIHVSQHWRELHGLTGDAFSLVTSQDWFALVHIEDRPACERFAASLRERPGAIAQVDFRIRRSDGSFAWQHFRGRTLPSTRDAAFAVGVVIELTAQREALLRLHKIERLEAVGQLTGGLAHDFNNLLTVIQGNVDLLNDELNEDPKTGPILEEISTVISRGAAVTRRMLSFARAGTTPEAASVLDPDTLIRSVVPLIEHTLDDSVVLTTSLAGRGWGVRIDPREFENAILNLAINARDAMPRGGTLTVSTRSIRLRAADIRADNQERPGSYVMVAVSDTGEGMPPEVLARVYEPFFTTKAEKGTGLGVPMVVRFVRESLGFVRFESEVGNGTTVRLYLPRTARTA